MPGKRSGRGHALLPLIVLPLIGWPLVALAHAHLLATTPAAGQALNISPPSITLNFDEAVRLAVLKLKSASGEVPVAIDRDAAPAKTVSVALPALKPGAYEVRWSAITVDDGHLVSGHFSFQLNAGTARGS